MNNIGEIGIAFIAGVFLVSVALAVLASLWVSWNAYRQGKAILAAITAIGTLQEQGIASQTKVLESGKGAFQGIKTELVRAMEAQTEIFRTAVKNLNGKALLEAAKQNVLAMRRLDEVATALHDLVISANENVTTNREWQEPARADEHAPEGASRIGRSIYAADMIDDQETENAFNAITGDTGEL